MIEVVYSGEEHEEQDEVRIPKNIHQIGNNSSNKKIYIEDYVMTYLKKSPSGEDNVKYGVLLGDVKRAKGNVYIFVKGMVEVRDVIENSIIFNDDIWSGIYKDIKQFFEQLNIVGWYVSVPYRVSEDMNGIKKIHLDNFAGNDKVCFLKDRAENEEGFYSYEQSGLERQQGYYIYYEKNEKMKKVIVFGATGNLGAYITIYLKSVGYDVIAVGHRKDDNGFFASRGMKYYSVDITKPEEFEQLPTENIYCVAHFAGELPSRYSFHASDLVQSITIGTLNVLEYMRSCGCKKIIFPQTPSDMCQYHNNGSVIPVDAPRHFPLTGDHSIYTIAKNAAVDLIEHYHAEYGFSRFILRFFTIYQYHPNAYHYRDFQFHLMPYRMLMDRASKSLPIEVWGNCKKAKEMVYIKDFVRVVEKCVSSPLEGGMYNVGNGWQVSLEEQIKGIIEVFSPKDNPSKIIYCPEKSDPLENAFDVSKTFSELDYKPEFSYIDQLRDFKKEMEEEPMAQLWGVKTDYPKNCKNK